MNRLGIDTVLVCSNVATATVDSDEVSAAQLRRLGDLAATYDVRVAFEALAWGSFIDDYRRAWRIVELADHPAVGTCLDSFHILSRGHDPAEIEKIPGDRIFFVQLADAPALSMDVLSWSRHHRLFPGEGDFDLTDFVGHVLPPGMPGHCRWRSSTTPSGRPTPGPPRCTPCAPWSRWTGRAARGAGRTASHPDVAARLAASTSSRSRRRTPTRSRSCSTARAHLRGPAPHQAGAALGRRRGAGRPQRAARPGTEPHGPPSACSSTSGHEQRPAREALAVSQCAPQAGAGDQRLPVFTAPHGLEVFLARHTATEPTWVGEFQHGQPVSLRPPTAPSFTGVDHVNLVHTWDEQDESVLFYTSVLGLGPRPPTEVASPQGLVRSRVMRTPRRTDPPAAQRAPAAVDTAYPEHVAFSCSDIFAVAAGARDRGHAVPAGPRQLLRRPGRALRPRPPTVDRLRERQLLYDRDKHRVFLHFYTRRIGRVFFEMVQRSGGYDGYGAANAPVRLAAQARLEP